MGFKPQNNKEDMIQTYVRFHQQEYEEIKEYAEKHNMTVANFIRQGVAYAIRDIEDQ